MLVLFLYFLSGVTSLVLEAVLLREMTWLLGSAAWATALVLSAFLAGLSLGAALLGRTADRVARPLRLYGVLEMGAGAGAIVVVGLLGPGRERLLLPLVSAGEGLAGRGATFAIAFVLLLVPTFLLGGTLPALSRFAVGDPRGIHRSVGLLYGANTLGGSLGVFVAGFFLFESLGIAASGYAAGILGIAVGLAAILVSGAVRGPSEGVPARTAAVSPLASKRSAAPWIGGSARARVACLAAAGMGGASVLGYEVIWTRLLSLPMRSYAYSFSLMLAIFLLGLVLGSLAVSFLRLGDRPLLLLGWVELAMGIHVASSVFWLPALLSPPEGVSSFGDFLGRGALRAGLIVLPPTFLSGMALPLAARGISPGRERIGREVGVLYSVNTLGSILGALGAGLVLLPALGAMRCLVVLAVLNAAAGMVVLLAADASRAFKLAGAAATVACALALSASPEPFVRAFLRSSIGREKISEVLLFREGIADTIAIVRKDYGFHDVDAKSLITNGVAMSATVKPVWRYMAVEGHLPVLFAKSPSRALVICLGTGITLGAVASNPALASIDAVELSDGVLEGLPLFAAENGEAFRDPRVRVIREDGRHFLELARGRYDVITLEPPPPIVAGAVHLYSLDFYEICKRRLSAGGVVAQWLPLHAQSLASARMTARTFLEAFPHAQLWLPSVRDAVLIGSEAPLTLDLARVREAFATPATRANLERAMLESPEAILGTYLLDRDAVLRWAGDAPVITDEHPRMEFFRATGSNMTEREIATLLPTQGPLAREGDGGAWSWIEGLSPATDADLLRRIEAESRALRLYVRSEAEGNPRIGLEAARLSRGTEFLLYPLGCTRAQLEALARISERGEAFQRQVARCQSIAPGSAGDARTSPSSWR